jgi:shikimate kinase
MGYRCTGKTSAGRLLAAKLQRPFFDTDELIRTYSGKTVQELVEEGGWDLFRREEKRVVIDLSSRDGCVIGLGGGAVLDGENMRSLRLKGFFVWLTAEARAIRKRMIGDEKSFEQRPPLSGESLEEEIRSLLKKREPLYMKIADCRIDTTNRSIEGVTEEILRIIRKTAGTEYEKRKQYGR